jgi:uncharacterized protein YaaQ
MNLVFAIVHDEDGSKVMDELNKGGFSVTKLCSTGGFLKSGNTTLITGVETNKVDQVIAIIKCKSKSRKQTLNNPMPYSGMTRMYTHGVPGNGMDDYDMSDAAFGDECMPYPVEVVVGGATIFVLNVEQFARL